jgi:hypothetical protein
MPSEILYFMIKRGEYDCSMSLQTDGKHKFAVVKFQTTKIAESAKILGELNFYDYRKTPKSFATLVEAEEFKKMKDKNRKPTKITVLAIFPLFKSRDEAYDTSKQSQTVKTQRSLTVRKRKA